MANNIWQEILDTRSFHVVEFKISDALSLPGATWALSPKDREVLIRMNEVCKLDEIYAIAHEQLGNHAKAKELRDFIAKKEKRLV